MERGRHYAVPSPRFEAPSLDDAACGHRGSARQLETWIVGAIGVM